MMSGTFFDSEPTLQFSAMPDLPTLRPSLLPSLSIQSTPKKQMSRAWLLLWMLPLLHFSIGGLLSLNMAMADSIVPTMADKEAHSNVRLIRMVIEPESRSTSHQELAPEQEQWMANTSQSPEDYEEVDVAQYLPLLQSPQTNAGVFEKAMKAVKASQKKNPFELSKTTKKPPSLDSHQNVQPLKDAKSAWHPRVSNPFTLKKPLARMQMTSRYGMRWGRMHKGIDLAASQGTPIVAAQAGTVVLSKRQGAYGLLVKVDHHNGLITKYAHCSKSLVTVGQDVAEGEAIALVGRTGRTTGPHLHFEVISEGKTQNPTAYL